MNRLRLWRRRLAYRLALWLWERLPREEGPVTASLQLLILGLTLIVIFQAALLVLLRPQ